MLELAALGLLMHEPFHGYRLKQQLEIFMGSCLSVNYGAIYPLLRRLKRQGLVEPLLTESAEDSNRRRFGITEKGRDRWLQKMLETPRESWVNSRSRFLIKSCFFGDLSPELRLALIEERLALCCERLAHLQSQTVQAMNVDVYRSLAIQRALDLLQSEVEWLNRLVAQSTEQHHTPPEESQDWTDGASNLEPASTSDLETSPGNPNLSQRLPDPSDCVVASSGSVLDASRT